MDQNNKPIDNALVEIFLPSHKKHWGRTDNEGKTDIHMQYYTGISNGKIVISSDGHKTKKLRFATFHSTNKVILKLRKKRD